MSLYHELKRRNVFRVAIAYLALAWLVTEIAGTLFPAFGIPDWSVRFFVIVFALGFAPALIISWIYEITPEGLKREKDVVRDTSITHLTARRLDLFTIGLIVVALAFILADRLWLSPRRTEQSLAPAEMVADSAPASEAKHQYPPSSIAVLPFVNMSDDPGNEYFSDGISEELLNVLVHVDGLHVASRTSSFAFKGENKNLEEISDALNVSHVLAGSVRKAGNRVRITAQLIEATTDRHLWSEIYDRDLTDIFAIQYEIANAIVAALREALEIEVVSDLPVSAATTNMSAYDLYLKAHELFITRTDLEGSVELFEQAVSLDPGFNRAWEGLAAAYSIMTSWGYADRDYLSLALEAADTAIQLDDSLSLAYSVIGLVYTNYPYFRWQDSFENFKHAAENDSRNATNLLWLARAHQHLGYFELAMTELDQCLSIDPGYGNCLRHKAWGYLLMGEREKAIDLYLRLLERDISGPQPMFVSAFALSGNRAAALLLADRTTGHTGAPIVDWVNLIEEPGTDRRDASKALDRWINDRGFDVNLLTMALAFGAHDRITGAQLFKESIWLPEFAKFRQSIHFKRFVSETNMQSFWRSYGFPPQCRPIGEDDFECD
jgi:adenylate cyclase